MKASPGKWRTSAPTITEQRIQSGKIQAQYLELFLNWRVWRVDKRWRTKNHQIMWYVRLLLATMDGYWSRGGGAASSKHWWGTRWWHILHCHTLPASSERRAGNSNGTHGVPETSSGSSWYINGLNEGIWRTDCMMTLEAAASSLWPTEIDAEHYLLKQLSILHKLLTHL